MAGHGEGHGQAVAATSQPGPKTKKKKKKSASMQQRRLELEDEVENLLRMLEHEERVHRVLEGALQDNAGGCALQIPAFLPKKTKELLAELAMVEEEITRLERQVGKIQQDLTEEKALQISPKPAGEYKHHIINPQTTHRDPTPDAPVEAAMEGCRAKVTAVETQPMFFINQAMKGEYGAIQAFSGKTKSASFGGATEKKGNPQMSGFEAKARRRSVLLEKVVTTTPETSTVLPPPPPPPKLLEHGHNMPFKSSKEPPLTSSSPGKSNQILQPNKLSERIMKCLTCIFLRMMRTSRSMELERSSITANSAAHPSLNLRSFRLDSSLNLKASLTTQRETARQDPYGIFEIEGSILRDIGPYKNLVRFTPNSMDAKGISGSMPLLRKLRVLMNNLQQIEPRLLNQQQKLAFWINVYNICIMNGFLEHGLPSNPEKVLALRNKAVLNVGGNKLNARAIEHSILRQPSHRQIEINCNGDKDEGEDTLRSTYGLEKPEPNVSFALCCGSKSSPAVRIYTADGIDSELEKAKLEYLQASIVVTEDRKLLLPKLLLSSLAGQMKPPVEWICGQLPTSGTLRKSITECLRVQNRKNVTEFFDVLPYQYEFQYLLFM